MAGPVSNSDETHPLTTVPGLPGNWIARLAAQWITTAEQVLSMSGTPQGLEGLKATVSPQDGSIEVILQRLSEVVGSERAAKLRQVSSGGPLGATLTEEQKKRFGLG